jgi:tape measure domain-containing protein
MPDISNLVIKIDSNGVVQANGNFGKFVEASENAKKAATGLEKSVAGLGNNFAAYNLIAARLPGPLKDIASGMMGLVSPATAATGAVIALTEAAVNFASGSLEAFGEYEMIKTNLELVMGSAEAAAGTFADLRDLAAKTPFSLPGVSQAASMLRQAGVAAGDLVSTIETLGNVSGGNMERFNRIAYNYTQGLLKGFLDARDIREFANNLVPINKVLQEMGVTGKVTEDVMVEAFRRMTAEGGMFFDAINRQGDTLIGKTEQMKEAWTEFRATWAETSGVGKLWKQILDMTTGAIRENTEALVLNQELQDLNNKKNAGTNTALDDYRRLSILLQMAEKELQNPSSPIYQGFDIAKSLADQHAYIANLTKQRDELQGIVDMINARNAAEAAWQEITATSASDYLTLQSQIQEAYAKTAAGQKEALENEIKLWRERQQATHLEWIKTDFGNGMSVSAWENVGISDEEYKKIDAIIAYLQASLEKSARTARRELQDWQKILMEHTGFTIDEMTKMWTNAGYADKSGKSLPIIESFSAATKLKNETLLDVLGGGSDEQLALAEQTAEAWEAIYRSMFTVKYDEATSRFVTVWTKSEEAAQAAEREWKNAIGVLEDANFDKYLADLEKASKLLAGTPSDRVLDSVTQTLQSNGVSDPTAEQIRLVLEANAAMFGKEIKSELDLTLMSVHNEAVSRLMIEKDIGYVSAERLLAEKENLEYIKAGRDFMAELSVDLQNALQRVRAGRGGLGEASVIMGRMTGTNMIQGTDAGAFNQGLAMGGPLVATVNMTVNALANVVGGLEGFSMILSPVTSLFEGFAPLIKALLVPLAALSFGARIAAEGLSWLFGWLVGDLDELYDTMTATNDERAREAELLRQLNEQYAKLRDSIEENEEYYLRKRRELNADFAIEGLAVNDMLLTPHGNFYTNPNDFIIATKNPAALGGGGTVVNISVRNEAGDVVSAAATQAAGPSGTEIAVMVRKIVAGDIASGRLNGAFDAMQSRNSGRRLGG